LQVNASTAFHRELLGQQEGQKSFTKKWHTMCVYAKQEAERLVEYLSEYSVVADGANENFFHFAPRPLAPSATTDTWNLRLAKFP